MLAELLCIVTFIDIMLARHFNQERHIPIEDMVYHIFSDYTLPKEIQSSEIANIVNEHGDMRYEFLVEMRQEHFVPIEFTPTHVKSIEITLDSALTQKIVRIKFHNDGYDSDFLLAEEYVSERDHLHKGYANKIFFSDRCTADMAATAYYSVIKLDFLTKFSVFSRLKIAQHLLQRFGSELYPTNMVHFLDRRIQDIHEQALLAIKSQRDNLYRSDQSNRLLKCAELNTVIKDIANDTWTYRDCYIDTSKHQLCVLFQSKYGLQTYTTNRFCKDGFCCNSNINYKGLKLHF